MKFYKTKLLKYQNIKRKARTNGVAWHFEPNFGNMTFSVQYSHQIIMNG